MVLMQGKEPGIRFAEESYEKMVANSSKQEGMGKPELMFLTGGNASENRRAAANLVTNYENFQLPICT